MSARPISTWKCTTHLSVSSQNCGPLGVYQNKVPAGVRLGYSQLPRQHTQIRNHIRRACGLSIFFFLLPFTYTFASPASLFIFAGCFSQTFDKEQEKAWLLEAEDNQQSGQKSGMWKWNTWDDSKSPIMHAVRYFGHSSTLLGCLNSTQHLYPVLAFTFACIDWIRKLVSKVESPRSLKGLRLGFWKSLNGRLKSSLDFLNACT